MIEKREEELKQKAETALNKRLGTYGYVNKDICHKPYTEGYIDGSTEATKELEKQIEKMKCCENCRYNSYWGNELHCNYGLKEAIQENKLVECNNMDKWELKV